MAFGGNKFKSACHQRAMNVAILATGSPFHAIIVTEHSAAFPKDDSEDCYIQVVIQSGSKMLDAINENEYFSLSFLAHSQMQSARDVYEGNHPAVKFETKHRLPYVERANSVLLCSLKTTVDLGGNTLVIGHVFDAIITEEPTKPLVNYIKSFCSVDEERTPVHSDKVKNPRLEDRPPPAT